MSVEVRKQYENLLSGIEQMAQEQGEVRTLEELKKADEKLNGGH